MNGHSWQLALCGLICAACFHSALAQKADFPAAARHAGELAKLDRASHAVTRTELEQKKALVVPRVPPPERPAFVSATPYKSNEAMYYYIVQDCIQKQWPKNCATSVSDPEREFRQQAAEDPLPGQSFPVSDSSSDELGRQSFPASTGAPGEPRDVITEPLAGSGYPGAQSGDDAWTQEFKQRSFEWHLLTTRIIFGMVVFIVGFGLYITYLQFKRDYTDSSYQQTTHERVEIKPADGEAAPVAVVVPQKSVTTMKLGPGGLELSSQIIGLAVLAFSLGFFYLYVKEIYPMNEVAVEKAVAQSKSSASK